MLKPLIFIAIGILLVLAVRWGLGQVASFSAQRPEHYADTTPRFDITQALNGSIEAEGLIYDFRGRVAARFTADMVGTWQNGTGTLAEDFTYSGGMRQQREWRMVMGEDGHFTATADDIIGTAQGRQMGSAVRLTYRIVLAEEAGGHVLDVVDWMYLMDNGVILNKSEFRKFGIKVAELVATFRKTAP